MASSNIFDQKKKLLQKITDDLENSFGNLSKEIAKQIIDEFVDRLDTKDGQIVYSSKNLQLITAIDKIYNSIMANQGLDIVKTIIKNVEAISKINVDYFSEFGGKGFEASTQKVQQIIKDRLGIGDKVKLKEGGYLDTLLKDNKVKNDIWTLIS